MQSNTFAEIELCVKEQKGEQEAKAKENQRLADENFGSSRCTILTIIENIMTIVITTMMMQNWEG